MIQRLRAFTLIELLVVIAIIGVLSSVVLSSLDTARDKGNDAAIKQDISQMPGAVELGRIENVAGYLEYGLACSTTPTTYGGNGGALFTDAASKTNRQVGSAVCSTYFEEGTPPPYSGAITGSHAFYSFVTAGSLTRGGGLAAPTTTPPFWAAAARLSNGTYFCVDQIDSPTTTQALTIGSNDYQC